MIPPNDMQINLVHWQKDDPDGRCVCEGHYLSTAMLRCQDSGIREFQINHFCLMMGFLDIHFPRVANEIYDQNHSDKQDILDRVYREDFWLRTQTARKVAKCTASLKDSRIQDMLEQTPEPHPINLNYKLCSIWSRHKIHWKPDSTKNGDLVKNVRHIQEFLIWNGGFHMRRNPEVLHPYD